MSYQPPFHISADAVNMIAEIAALVERFTSRPGEADALKLRRVNQIKTIQATLAIEGNSLSEEQVLDISNGKSIVGPSREIQEVRNAIMVYNTAQVLDPYSIDDFLKAHGIMMFSLIDEAGVFRHGDVGVVKAGEVLHFAPPSHRINDLVKDLFEWLYTSEDHPLIRSCVFHYELEIIHPFADGNGRMGRLWQSLILAKWNPVFLQLPVETMVYNNQDQYYQAINQSTNATDSGIFVDFMLRIILNALLEHSSFEKNIYAPADAIFRCIQTNPGLRAGMIAEKLSISRRTVERYLQELKQTDKIEFRGAFKTGGYYPK